MRCQLFPQHIVRPKVYIQNIYVCYIHTQNVCMYKSMLTIHVFQRTDFDYINKIYIYIYIFIYLFIYKKISRGFHDLFLFS